MKQNVWNECRFTRRAPHLPLKLEMAPLVKKFSNPLFMCLDGVGVRDYFWSSPNETRKQTFHHGKCSLLPDNGISMFSEALFLQDYDQEPF